MRLMWLINYLESVQILLYVHLFFDLQNPNSPRQNDLFWSLEADPWIKISQYWRLFIRNIYFLFVWFEYIHKDNENKVTIIWINPSLMKLTIELHVCFSDNDVSREVSTDISWVPAMCRSLVVLYRHHHFYSHKSTVRVNKIIILQTRKH